MSLKRKKFYERIINKIISNKNSKILVLGATMYDSEIFKTSGYSDVTISNLDSKNLYHPYCHSTQDIRKLSFNDESFDYVVANACIHHTSRPHNAILEMYRVSKKGIIVIEGNDSKLIKLSNYLKLSQEFELSAVTDKKDLYDLGGVDNSNIPNFVFRWTKREVYKLVTSYEPQYIHKIHYFYESDFEGYKNVRRIKLVRIILFFMEMIAKIYFYFFNTEKNLFCFFINKEERKFQKWIKLSKENKFELDQNYIKDNI